MAELYLVPSEGDNTEKDERDISETAEGQAAIEVAKGIFSSALQKAGIEFVTEEHGNAFDSDGWTVVPFEPVEPELEQ